VFSIDSGRLVTNSIRGGVVGRSHSEGRFSMGYSNRVSLLVYWILYFRRVKEHCKMRFQWEESDSALDCEF
jgi:hypothetical protein